MAAAAVTLRENQLRYLEEILAQEASPGCLFADLPGFGKSLAAIHAIQGLLTRTEYARAHALIVVPTSLSGNVWKEINKYPAIQAVLDRVHVHTIDQLVARLDSPVAGGAGGARKKRARDDDDAEAAVRPSSLLSSPEAELEEMKALQASMRPRFDALMDPVPSDAEWILWVDEVHLFRNKLTKRGKLLRVLANWARARILTTGTPFNNAVGDMANLMAIARGELVAMNPDFLDTCAALNKEGQPTKPEVMHGLCDGHVSFSVVDRSRFPRTTVEVVSIVMTASEYDEYRRIEEQVSLSLKNVSKKIAVPAPSSKKARAPSGSSDESCGESSSGEDASPSEKLDSNAFFFALRKHVNTLGEDEIGCSRKAERLCEIMRSRTKTGQLPPNTVVQCPLLVFGLKRIVPKIQSTFPGCTFLTITGDTAASQRQAIVDQYNAVHYGMVLILSDVGGVGLDLRCTRLNFITQPGWNVSTDLQKIGRTDRFDSHADLPFDERISETFILVIDKPGNAIAADGRPAMDRYLLDLAASKQAEIEPTQKLLEANYWSKTSKRLDYSTLLLMQGLIGPMRGGGDGTGGDMGGGGERFLHWHLFRPQMHQIRRHLTMDTLQWIKSCTKTTSFSSRSCLSREHVLGDWDNVLALLEPEYSVQALRKKSKAYATSLLDTKFGSLWKAYGVYRTGELFRVEMATRMFDYEEACCKALLSLKLLNHYRYVQAVDGSSWKILEPLKKPTKPSDLVEFRVQESGGAQRDAMLVFSYDSSQPFELHKYRWEVHRHTFTAVVSMAPMLERITPYFLYKGVSLLIAIDMPHKPRAFVETEFMGIENGIMTLKQSSSPPGSDKLWKMRFCANREGTWGYWVEASTTSFSFEANPPSTGRIWVPLSSICQTAPLAVKAITLDMRSEKLTLIRALDLLHYDASTSVPSDEESDSLEDDSEDDSDVEASDEEAA